MSSFPAPFQELIDRFQALPGIGAKSAERLAYHVLSLPEEDAESLAQAVLNARRTIHLCPVCQNFTDGDLCPICRDESRDHSLLCVVAQPKDVASVESGGFQGVYHVLHGVLSPMNHIGPNDLSISQLMQRVAGGGIREVLMATNPDTEGDTTASYLADLLRPYGIITSRLGFGIPVGSSLEYADGATMTRAIMGRRKI